MLVTGSNEMQSDRQTMQCCCQRQRIHAPRAQRPFECLSVNARQRLRTRFHAPGLPLQPHERQ